jgi:hypothetical protein
MENIHCHFRNGYFATVNQFLVNFGNFVGDDCNQEWTVLLIFSFLLVFIPCLLPNVACGRGLVIFDCTFGFL